MDLMDNLTGSQENPDSSPGFTLHLASTAAEPSQGPAAPVATAYRNRADPGWELTFFSRWLGAGEPETCSSSLLDTPTDSGEDRAEDTGVCVRWWWWGELVKIYDGYDLFWNLGEKKPFL